MSSATCERERPGLGVDPDDLGLDRGRLADQQQLEVGVGHDLGVVLERRSDDLLLLGRVEHRALLPPGS